MLETFDCESPAPEHDSCTSVFNPIIYTVVYGPDHYFECLAYFIESLRTFGEYGGSIWVYTDRDADEVLSFIPGIHWEGIQIKSLGGATSLKRYHIDDLPQDAGPILYLDSDIIVSSCIYPILKHIHENFGVHVASESSAYPGYFGMSIEKTDDKRKIGNWWGLELLRSDQNCKEEIFSGINSGAIGFSNRGEFELIGRSVIEICEHVRHENLRKYFGDQPFLNYVLMRTGAARIDTLTPEFAWRSSPPDLVDEIPKFTHFVWSRDQDKPKQMLRYLTALRTHMLQSGKSRSEMRGKIGRPSYGRLTSARHIFVITSALCPASGVISDDARVRQSLETIESIRTRAPRAAIMFIDSSPKKINADVATTILETVDLFVDLSGDNPGFSLRELSGGFFRTEDYVKTLTETWILIYAFLYIKTLRSSNPPCRIFKISGRYRIGDYFNLSMHESDQAKQKFVFKKRGEPWLQGRPYYNTRLWSVDGSLIKTVLIMLLNVYFCTFDEKIDVEHSYFATLRDDDVFEIDQVGVEGHIASTGVFVSE